MKNYRALERYTRDEWEDDDEWKGKRLAFLWITREDRHDLYDKYDLGIEKNDFYETKTPKIDYFAFKEYLFDFDDYDKFYKNNFEKMAKDFILLQDIKMNNFSEFLLKKNCNKSHYLEQNFYRFKFYYEKLMPKESNECYAEES